MRAGRTERDTCRDLVLPALGAAGWRDEQVVEQYRLQNPEAVHAMRDLDGELRVADYVLEIVPGLPVAVVEAKREYQSPAEGIQQALDYAARLDVPFAFSTNGHRFVLHDLNAGTEREVESFPTPEEMWADYLAATGTDRETGTALTIAFDRTLRTHGGASFKVPRYYQRTAVHRVLRAIHSGRGRVLLLMATGTGKTFTALQLVHKLREYARLVDPDRPYRVLYLADRDFLVEVPQSEFEQVFGGAVTRLSSRNAPLSRELYFATYQALDTAHSDDDESDEGVPASFFESMPSEFFDLVIVDECHRGSASPSSSWRGILDHFSSAVQVGLTATPKRDANIDTYDYFGEPVFEYSLRQGIEDGYLAPYRVRRVVLDIDAHGWSPTAGQRDRFGREIPEGLYTSREFERVLSVLERTEVVARHLVAVLASSPGARAIVFCVDAEHAQQMRQSLIDADPDRSRRQPGWVARIVGSEPERKRLISEFTDPDRDLPAVATTARLLSTGVDVEDLKYVVLFRPVGSMVEFKQIVGRGTRLYPDKGKFDFEVIDYVGAAAKFDDPEFDGPPMAPVRRERVMADGVTVVEEAGDDRPDDDEGDGSFVVREPIPDFAVTDGPDADAAVPGAGRKLYVDGVSVQRIGETFRILDPSTGSLTTVEYGEYVGDQVRKLFPGPESLRARWRQLTSRSEVERELERRGIRLAELLGFTGLIGADPFDVLLRAAWDVPPVSRRERAERVRVAHAAKLDEYSEAARSVLEVLLDRYAELGIGEVDSQQALRVPPLSELGTPVEIASEFGGAREYRQALDELQEWIFESSSPL